MPAFVRSTVAGTVGSIKNSNGVAWISIPEEQWTGTEEVTVWHRLKATGALAERIMKLLHKGSVAAFQCNLNISPPWQDDHQNWHNGVIHYVTHFEPLSNFGKNGADAPPAEAGGQETSQAQQQQQPQEAKSRPARRSSGSRAGAGD